MNFADIETVDEETDDLEKNPGCLSGLLRGVMILVAVLVLVLALLPALLSTDPARRMVLDAVNRSIAPAKVDAGDWSLGWLSKVSVSKPFFENPSQGVLFNGDEIRFDRGLLRLLPVGKLDLGMVTLVKPDVSLSLEPPPAAEPVTVPKRAEEKERGFFLPVLDVGAGVAVEDGRLEMRGGSGDPFVASRVKGRVRMDSYRKPTDVDLSMVVGGGTVTLQGRVQSIRDFIQEERDSDAQAEKISLKLVNVDITVLRPLMLQATGQEWLESGKAEGVVTVEQSGKKRFAAECGVLVNGFSLKDGERARSPAGDLALMAELRYAADGVVIRKFDFASPWLRAEAKGTLYGLGTGGAVTGGIKAEAVARLPLIARDFAAALGLSPTFAIEKGDLNLSFGVEGGTEALLVAAQAKTSGLLMKSGGTALALKPEPSLLFKARFPYGKWPEVETLHFKAPFADLYGKGRFDSAVLKGHLDLTRFAKDFKNILKDCPPMVGLVYVDVSTSAGADLFKINSFVKLSDLAVEINPGQMTIVPKGSIKFSGSVPVKEGVPEKELNGVDFNVVLEGGNIEGQWQRLALPADGRDTVLRGLSVKSSLDISSAGRLLGGVLPAPASRRLRTWQGLVLANVTAEMAGGAFKARVNAGGSEMRCTVGDGAWSIPSVRLEGAVSREGAAAETGVEADVAGGVAFERDGKVVFAEPAGKGELEMRMSPGGERLLVPKLKIKAGLLDMDASAEVQDLSGRCMLQTKGVAALDFAALKELLEGDVFDDFQITGRKAREFKFVAPMAGGWLTTMSEGEFSGASCIESLKGMGLSAGPADISMRLSRGVARMEYTPVLNGGRLRLVPEARFSTRGVSLMFPPKTRLLENVAITQEMVDLLLAQINPLFMGSVVKRGTVTVDLKHFNYVPDATPEKQLTTEMDIVFNQLSMDMGPALREVLSLVRVKNTRYAVERLPVTMTIKDGRVHLAPLRIVVDQQPIVVSGWTAFDGKIKYLIEVPVTERLAGKNAGKLLRDRVIKIPVTGTVEEPRLDTSALKNAMTDILKNMFSEEAAEKVGNFLEKLQRELLK